MVRGLGLRVYCLGCRAYGFRGSDKGCLKGSHEGSFKGFFKGSVGLGFGV